jgi:thioredoxin-related protein
VKITKSARVVLVLFGVVSVLSCSRDRPTKSDGQSLNWVGTSVLYHPTEGKKAHSLIFVLVTWCGWCKKMKSETLADTSVCRILNESFNIAQIDPESDSLVVYQDTTVTCRYLAGTVYNVRGYPTTIVLDKEGALIGAIPGYQEPVAFVDLLQRIRDGEFDTH